MSSNRRLALPGTDAVAKTTQEARLMTRIHARPIRRAALSAVAALGLAALLGGCVVAPAYPGYAYGYGPGYGYAPGYVAVGGGWGWGGGWHGGGGWHR
jgi:hypothetical protein